MNEATGRELNQLQRTLLSEYAIWSAFRDADRAPVLGRILTRHGEGMLPVTLRSLQGDISLSQFLFRWLSISFTQNRHTYFESLLNIEHDAVRVGCEETFLLLQDSDSEWLQMQRARFEHIQASNLHRTWGKLSVDTVELHDGYAWVTLSGVATDEGVSHFFRRSGADWVHALPQPRPEL
jgi:hypothetical protein